MVAARLARRQAAPYVGLSALLLLTAACGRISVATQPSGPIVLAVVTWNMNAGRGDLPRLLADLETGGLTGAPVQEYVILLQEAVDGGAHDVTALAGTKRLSAFHVPVWYDGRRLRGNAIVSTRPLVNARAIALPQERQPRTAVVAAIEVAGQRLFVVSTHLENRITWLISVLFSDSARRRQAEALLRALPESEPGILGGDFNTWLGINEPAWRAFGRRFTDTPAGPQAPTFRDRLVLDHLFFDLPDGWRATRRVLPDKYGSDHHPVLGVITSAE